jgi:hypothetical protein
MLDPREPSRPEGRARDKVVTTYELGVDEEGHSPVRTHKSKQSFYGTEEDQRRHQGQGDKKGVAPPRKLRFRRAIALRLSNWRFFLRAHVLGLFMGSGGYRLTSSSNGASCSK